MTTAYNSESGTTILEKIQGLIASNHELVNRAKVHLDAVAVGLLGPHPETQGHTRADVSSTEGILDTIHQDLLETNYHILGLAGDLYRLRSKLLPADRVSGG